MDNDIMINQFYIDYLDICDNYEKGYATNEETVANLKTLQESIGIYISGLFELKRREKGGE